MNSSVPELGTAPERVGDRAAQEGLRAVLVTAGDGIRQVVHTAIREAGLPIEIGLELAATAHALEADHLDRIRAGRPHLIVLDMMDEPEHAIRIAAGVTAANPHAALVGLGPQLDAPVLLDAMRAGLVEYVPVPTEVRDVHEALARILRKKGWDSAADGHRNGQLMAFFSAKGGSGSTSVVTNVGIELHRLTGKKTLLVDLDLELGEIASLLGVQPRFHFVDLVRNFHRMDADLLPSYIESHASGVHVLSAPLEPEIGQEVTGEQIARILGFLRTHYDYVLVDTAKSLAPPALAALQTADPVFLVTNMDVPSLKNLKRCLPILHRVTGGDADKLRLIVNRFNPKSLVRPEDLEDTLGLEIYWKLVNDYETVIQAISTGQPLVLEGNSRYAEELKALARTIAHGRADATVVAPSLMGRILSSFKPSSGAAGAPLAAAGVEASHG
jgi:pilus assembly protein CpaE